MEGTTRGWHQDRGTSRLHVVIGKIRVLVVCHVIFGANASCFADSLQIINVGHMQGGAELEEPFDLKVEWLQKFSPMTAAVRTYGRGACMSSVRSTDGSMSVADCSGVRWFAVRRNAPTEGDWGRSNQSAAHGGKRFTPMLATRPKKTTSKSKTD